MHPSAIDVALSSKEQRIEWIKNPRWIGYPRAQEILGQLDDLVRFPRQTRMPSMLLIGESNNGKTKLIESFLRSYPADENIGGEHIIAKVLYIEAPPVLSESTFYGEILSALFENVSTSSLDASRRRVIEVLEDIELKVLVIDELHNILAGPSLKQHSMLNALKYVSNKLKISIVGCGTSDLLRAVSIDPQIQNRFKPTLLPKWKMGKELQRLLKSFEVVLPLQKASRLHDQMLASKILAMSEGTIGEISLLLNAATTFAIQADIECINAEVLNACDYVSPSDRIKFAAGI